MVTPPDVETVFEARFKFQRDDYVAMTQALTRRPFRYRLRHVALFYACALIPILVLAGSMENILHFFGQMVRGDLPWWFYLVFVVGGVFLLSNFRPIAAFCAGLAYKQIAIADKDVTVTFSDSGIVMAGSDIKSEIDWNAVQRMIDVGDRLFLCISGREALVVPNRAFESAADYDALRAYALRKIREADKSVPGVRQRARVAS